MEQKDTAKGKKPAALFWSIFEKTGAQVCSVVFQFILARILSADEFGNLAVLIVFVNLATTFAQNGFSSALIRKQDADALDYSSVFYCNIGLSAVFYAVLFFTAPSIARFYGEPLLTNALRVLALMLFGDALTYVQNCILTKQLRFREIFFRSIIATVVSGVVAVIAALNGWGLWALILQYLLKSVLYCIVTILRVRWKPLAKFSVNRIRGLFGFSIRVLAQSLIANLSTEIRTLLIGKQYTTDSLAYYDRGQSFPKLFGQGFSSAMTAALLPILSPLQNDREALLKQFRRYVALTSFIYFPLMTGLAGISESFVSVLLGEKWMQAVPFLMVFCFAQIVQPLNMIMQTLFYAVNRSDITLRLTAARFVADLVLLLITLRLGPLWIAVGSLAGTYLFFAGYCLCCRKYIGYTFLNLISDLWKPLLSSLLCFFAAFALSYLQLPAFVILVLQVIAGVLVYIAASLLLRNRVLLDAVHIIKSKLIKKN